MAYGKSEILYEEEDIVLVAVGSMVKTAVRVRQRLKEIGYACSLVNACFVKPLDEDMIREMVKGHKLLVTMEENVWPAAALGNGSESICRVWIRPAGCCPWRSRMNMWSMAMCLFVSGGGYRCGYRIETGGDGLYRSRGNTEGGLRRRTRAGRSGKRQGMG